MKTKTSKRLLSFFLAVVMVVTTCSVGFTAFAKDSDSIWSTNADAESSFAALTDVINNQVMPLLTGSESIASALEDALGMEVNEDTTLSDLVGGLAPTLVNALGSYGNTVDSVASSYNSHYGTSNNAQISTNSATNDIAYAYLEDPDAGSNDLNIWSLYSLAYSLRSASDSDVKEYANETLDELDQLIAAYSDAQNNALTEEKLLAGMAIFYAVWYEIDPTFSDETFACMPLGYADEIYISSAGKDLGDIDMYDGDGPSDDFTALYNSGKDIIEQLGETCDLTAQEALEAVELILDYLNLLSEFVGNETDFSTLSEFFYYFMVMMGSEGTTGYYDFYAPFYLALALAGGAEIKLDGNTALTLDNYVDECSDYANYIEVFADLFGYDATQLKEDYNDSNVSDDDFESTYGLSKTAFETFETTSANITIYNLLTSTHDYSKGRYGTSDWVYYGELSAGLLAVSGLYGTVQEATDYIDSCKISDEELLAFAKALKEFSESGGTLNIANTKAVLDETVNSTAATYIKTTFSMTTDTAAANQTAFITMVKIMISCVVDDDDAATLANLKKITIGDNNNEYSVEHYLRQTSSYSANYVLNYTKGYVLGTEPFFETFNNLIPGFILCGVNEQQYVEGVSYLGDPIAIVSTLAEISYYSNIALSELDEDGDGVVYKYSDYKVPDSAMVYAANSLLNNVIGNYVNSAGHLVIGTIIDIDLNELLGEMIGQSVDINSIIDDIFLRLYQDPISTIFELVPILVAAVDEVLLPMFLLIDEEDISGGGMLYSLLDQLISSFSSVTQEENSATGIGQLCWDLNVLLPDLMHWLLQDENYIFTYYNVDYSTYDDDGNQLIIYNDTTTGTYKATHTAESNDVYTQIENVPVITNIFAVDVLLGNAQISDIDGWAGELVTELATFFSEAVDEYLSTYVAGETDIKYFKQTYASSGLNNLFVALPKLIDIMGQKFNEKYGVDSDWTYLYDGKFYEDTVTDEDTKQDVTVTKNATVENLKSLCYQTEAADVLDWFVGTLTEDWLGALIDLLNDLISTDNSITNELPIVAGLLNAVGGLGEESILTELLNGVFQLQRSDEDWSFTFEPQEKTGYVALDTNNVYFLIVNIPTLIEVITNLIDDINGTSTTTTTSLSASSLLSALSGSSDDDTITATSETLNSASGYSEENLSEVSDLIDNLDNTLSSVLADSTINGFDVDTTSNVLAGVFSALSNYLNNDMSSELIKLINMYIAYITAASSPDDNGDLNVDDVYTNDNLTTLVVETYAFLEDLVEYFLSDFSDTYTVDGAEVSYNLLSEAINGVISPDSVAVRLDDNEDAQEVLSELGAWDEALTEVNNENLGKVNISIDWGISDGDSDAFFTGLASSLRLVTSVLGVLLVDAGWYENILMPIFEALCGANGIDYDTAAQYSANQEEILLGIIRPIGDFFDAFLKAPATTLLNSITGLAGILDDSSGATIASIVKAAIEPIDNELNGLANILDKDISNLSPTLAQAVREIELDEDTHLTFSGIYETDSSNALVNITIKGIALSGSNLVSIISAAIGGLITLPDIDWAKLSGSDSPADTLVAILDYVVSTVLINDNLDYIASLINNDVVTTLIDAIKNNNIKSSDILSILNMVLEVTSNPTLAYWTFEQYLLEAVENFKYPTGLTKTMANEAVTDIDTVINNLFPVLESLGVDLGGDTLEEIISENLFTNSLLTSAVKGIYNALDSNSTVKTVMEILGVPTSTTDVAALLTDSSYGATYSSAAKTIKAASSWSDIKTINWGFTDGSSNAQEGFVNALVAILRPFNNLLSVFLNEGTLELSETLYDLIYSIEVSKTSGTLKISDEYIVSYTYSMSKGIFTFQFEDQKTASRSGLSTVKIDLTSLKDTLSFVKIEGTNGYNSAVIALLEALGCSSSDIKTYKQYQSDVKSAKDNLLLDILNPIVGSSDTSLLNQIVSAPIQTIATILPTIAMYLDAHGLSQAIVNLLYPVTNIVQEAAKSLKLNSIIKSALGESLGDYLASLLGMNSGELTVDLEDLSTINLEDIVIPLVNTILANQSNTNVSKLKFADIDWVKLIDLGTRSTYTSKATDENGKSLTGKTIKNVDYGKTLIVFLRYVLNAVKDNITPIKSLLLSIDAISKSDTLKAVINNVCTQIGSHSADQIIVAIYYFFIGDTTESYWNYSDYTVKNYKFSYPDGVTEENVTKLISFLDGIIDEIDLESLISDYLYTDDIINSLVSLIYVSLGEMTVSGSITVGDILDILDISLDTSSVAKMLKDSSYGETSQFKKAAKAIAKASSWSDVDIDSLSWGVKDEETFLNALVAILRPFYTVLDVLLADGTWSLLGGISIPGSNDYESSIVPLLEALQCSNVKTYKQYLKDINKSADAILLDILNPIMDLVDEVLANPIDALASRLPNIALFIANDGLLQLVTNLITPITAIVQDVLPVIDVDKLLQDLTGIDDLSITNIDEFLEQYIGADNIVPLINSLISSLGITLDDINWFKLASLGTVNKKASSAALNASGKYTRYNVEGDSSEVIIQLLRYVLNTVLNNGDAIKSLLGDSYTGTLKDIIDLIFNLKADDLLSLVFKLVDITQSPTEVYWCYEYYSGLVKTFEYPSGITADEADAAVDSLDTAVSSVLSLLQGLGVIDDANLSDLVGGLIFKNEYITKLASALYGALDTETLSPYLEMAGIPVSQEGVAELLTDKSYGATYSSAAKAIKAADSWSSLSDVNWGFTDGAANAEQGFVNALVAVLRPVLNVLTPFLNGTNLELGEILYNIVVGLNISSGDKSKKETLVTLKNGKLTIKTYDSSAKKYTTALKLDLSNLTTLKTLNLYGSNAYESAIIPLLDAFQIDDIKTYDEYCKDIEKAKDNALLDILNPIVSFVDDVLEAPFDTITSVLPNVAYFIDNNGIGQLLNNLLSPVTQFLVEAKADGVDIDEILEIALGKDLGTLVTDALGVNNVQLNLTLTDLNSCNIQDIVVPLLQKLLANYGLSLPTFTWANIASHGEVVTSASAAKNSTGKYTNKEVIADRGEVLVAVLRYVADLLIDNSLAINELLSGIDAIKNSELLTSILLSIFTTISLADKDDIVRAIFYLLDGDLTNAFWDYTGYEVGEYEFSYPDTVDQDFLTILPIMIDGLVTGLIDLNETIGNALYKDSIISSIAVGLYGAVEGVSVGSSNLAELLAQTDIDFTADNVANLLVDTDYGRTYESAAATIKAAGSWANVNKDDLTWGVTDRDSFMHALCAVLRPIYGVLDVLLNDASLGIFNIVRIPGTNGYTSTIVPLLEAFSCYNIKTQYEYREDINEEYDNILLDIINPLWDKVEDLLYAPIQVLASMLPNLALFIGNDGLCQLIDNLLVPISALLDSVSCVVDLNDLVNTLLDALDVDLDGLLAKIGITNFTLDLYNIGEMLKPILGGDAIIPLVNNILGLIEISGVSLGLKLNDVDWLQLASHGTTIVDMSQAATYGARIYVEGDSNETLIAVLRYLVDTVNAGDNMQMINDLIGGLLGDNVSDTVSDVIAQVLGILEGDTDTVISELCDLLQTFA